MGTAYYQPETPPKGDKIRILLADDHPLILRGLQEFLAEQDDMQVVGAESDPTKVVDAVGQLEPDVLIQDLAMQGELTGLGIIRSVKGRYPATQIVVLSMHISIPTVWEAFQQGALGYATKLGDLDELKSAIAAASEGRQFLGKPLSESALEEYGRHMADSCRSTLASLTKRELEVLGMVAQGRTSSEIAEALDIGRRTVESHRANFASKLRLRNQAEIVRYAMERGLVDGP